MGNNQEYTFPFSTCETVQSSGVAQPFSFWVNFINCVIILYFLLQTKNAYTFPLLFSILCFEGFHMFSHYRHIPGLIQTYVAHGLSYCINVTLLYAFYSYTGELPTVPILFFLAGVIVFDLTALLFGYPLIFYVLSQSLIFTTLLFYYFATLPKFIQQGVWLILGLITLVIVLMLNEKYNCRNMKNVFPDFPFHIILEFAGIALFYVICSRFYLL